MGLDSIFHRKKKPNSSSATASASASTTSPNHNGSPHPLITGSKNSSSNLRTPQVHELEEVFKKFDVNGDGKISASELGSMMSSLGHAATEEEVQKMMREIDSDGDGFIDFEEFVELNTKGVDSEEIMENLKDAFSVYDIDGNGSISAEELFQVLRSLGDECTIADCRKMISGVDSDGDGTIDFEEFKVMMMMGSRYEFDPLHGQQVAV